MRPLLSLLVSSALAVTLGSAVPAVTLAQSTMLVTSGGAAGNVAMGAMPGMTPMLAMPITMSPVGTVPPPSMPMIVMVPTAFASPIANTQPIRFNYYQVKSGGRLRDVARRTGVPLAELRRLNPGIANGQYLSAGTLVTLPQS